jgi:hypothetical protein
MNATWASGSQAWAWLAIAGLGVFHGLNPAMGWLFAVALGLHRHNRRSVLLAIPPMALGHALSIGLVAAAVLALGVVVNTHLVRMASGVTLILWAFYHARYGHRHRVRVGMMTGFAGLVLWSFLMATAHGAGLMLIPALIPLCGHDMAALSSGSLRVSLAAVGLHTASTLIVTAAVALLVYDWLGVGVLRRGWINFDRIWFFALVATGLLLIATS